MKKLLVAGSCSAALGLVALAAYAQVAGTGTQAPRLIPYVGHLDKDGLPVTGKVAMKICLVSDASAGCDAATWVETFESVDVAGGNFSLVLGQTKAVPDTLKSGSTVYIRAMVGAYKEGGGTTFVQLSGAQRLLSVPYAINVDGATTMRVDGPIHTGSTVPALPYPGMVAETQSQPLMFATRGGDILWNRSANPANQFNPPLENNAMGLLATGLKLNVPLTLANSQPISRMTTCHVAHNQPMPKGNKIVQFSDQTCNHGAPAGQCAGFFGSAQECGGGVAYKVLYPGDANAPTGGAYWYNEVVCGDNKFIDVEVTYLCSQ